MSTTTPEAPTAPKATEPRRNTLRIVATWAVLVAAVLVSLNLVVIDYVGLRAYAAVTQLAQTWGAPTPGIPAPVPAPSAPIDPNTNNPATEAGPAQTEVIQFGQAHTFKNGVKMTIGAPEKYKPSRYATVSQPHAVSMTVTVENGSQSPVGLTGAVITASSGQQEGSQIFDTTGGMNGEPSTQVLPGKTVTFDIAFGVQDPADVTVQASPGFDYSDQIWTNSAYRP